MLKRSIEYCIKSEYIGKKISFFLKEQKYPESALTKLRHTEGSILINGKAVHMNYVFGSGLGKENSRDSFSEILSVLIYEDDVSKKIIPVELSFSVIYEDEDIIVLDKPHHMPVHPSLNNYDNSLANAVAWYFAKKNEPFVFRCLNRLDRDTSGLTVLAKHYLAAGIMSNEIADGKLKREYTAIVSKTDDAGFLPESGTIDKPIGRKSGSTIERFVDEENGEKAVTHYRVVNRFSYDNKELLLIKCILETGRTHQIRVHFTSIGYPLIGDFLYNPDDKIMTRQALHAGKLSFIHPISGEYLTFESKVPDDMQLILDKSGVINEK